MTALPGCPHPASAAQEAHQVVSVRLSGQCIALPVEQVRDVFQIEGLTPVPLAGPSVLGLVNLRGRIVLVYSLAALLGLEDTPVHEGRMAVGVRWNGEDYGLAIDDIGDVLALPPGNSEPLPIHLTATWARHARRVHKLDQDLMIELDLMSMFGMPLILAA